MTHAHMGSAAHAPHKNFAHPVRNVAALGLEPGMKVADFGSGSGAYVLAIAAALHNSGHIYAIDVQKDLLRRIHNDAKKAGYTNVDILWGDLEERHGAKVADSSLDFVLISNLLFQVRERENVVAEAFRVLRGGGRCAIIDWSESPPVSELRMGPQRDDVVTKSDASALARDAGFTFIREFNTGAHHYGLLFRKSRPAHAVS